MDLIYMNSAMIDQGVLSSYEIDLAFGADENSFECTISSDLHCCNAGDYLYIEGTEYGGIVDAIEVRTEEAEIIYSGRTWHGIIGSKVIVPLTSSDQSTQDVTIQTTSGSKSLVDRYLIISGDANKCIGFILNRLGLSSLFTASTEDSVQITSYKFNRYVDGYTGLQKMLASVGMKLDLKYTNNGKVTVSAITKKDYSNSEEFDPSLVDMQLKKRTNSVNHLICLGSGEMENRTIIHLYADAQGNISQTQTIFGMDEYVSTYDYSSVESDEELLKSGTEELKTLWKPDDMKIKLDESSDFFGVGDKIGAKDNITGISVSATIQKKIISIRKGIISISYEVGE